MLIGPAKFDVNRCNKSPLRGEKPDFWPMSKFNTGNLPLCGNLEGNAIPLGYSHTNAHYAGGGNNCLNSSHAKYYILCSTLVFYFLILIPKVV